MSRLSAFACAVALIAGCAHGGSYVAGTKVPYSENNKSVLDRCEEYRMAVENRDSDALMLMAHPQYWEDSGTPSGSDDYGYDGLREVLVGRFQRADDIRYSMKYVKVRRQGQRAYVEVVVDASYTITTSNGEQRMDQRDQNQLVLEWDGEHWMFVSGM